MFHKRLLSEFKENKRYVAEMVACKWISLLANIAFIYGTALFLYQIYRGELVSKNFIEYIVLTGIVLVVRGIMNAVHSKLSFRASTLVKVRLRELIYRKLIALGSGYRERIKTSEAVQVSTEGIEQLEIYFGSYVPQFFYSLLAPITLFCFVSTISIKTAIVLFICVPLIPVSIVVVQKFAKKMLNKYWGTYTGLGDSFLENLNGLTTLKIYRADERYGKKMDEEAEEFRKVTMRVLIMQLNSISVMDLVAYGGAALGIVFSVLELKAGNINLLQCFFIIMAAAEFFLPLRLLGSFFHIAMNGNAAANKIFALLDQELPEKGNKELTGAHTIRFEHVSFGYEEENVVNELTFEIKQSQFVAFVGESGCGKSTIASLIMGRYQNFDGDIRIGDTKLNDIDSKSLYREITRITHDSYLLTGTVRENLLMGKEDASEQELFEVLRKVDLYDMVKQNGGLEMAIEEQGNNLSGGQKQRMAVARALLHNSPIYIFDEATSNVDMESENKIMDVIQELAKEKTVILISHRLANVKKADHIFVMEKSDKNGSITETGDHNSLIEQKGYYNNIYQSQRSLEMYGKEV